MWHLTQNNIQKIFKCQKKLVNLQPENKTCGLGIPRKLTQNNIQKIFKCQKKLVNLQPENKKQTRHEN